MHKDVYALSTKLNISASSLLNLHTELPALETPLIYEESAQDNVIDSSDSQITEKTTEESSNDNTNLEELAEKYNVEDNTQSVSLDTETTENETVEERADIPEEIAKEMPDAIGVEETNDGSGLTYISYEPNSEFNEDLNIQPDSFMDNEENNE